MCTYKSLHSADNFSDHCPLLLQLKIPIIYSEKSICKEQTLNWDSVTKQQLYNYKSKLNDLLGKLKVPVHTINCTVNSCTNVDHIMQIQEFHDNIIECCLNAATDAVGFKAKNKLKKPAVPGWSSYVSHHKEVALYWHSRWSECGYPRHGYIAHMRRKTRASYHYAIMFIKKNNDFIIANKMAKELLKTHPTEFWNDVKKVKGVKFLYPNNVDGVNGESEISNLFANKWEELYNSVSYNNVDLTVLKHDIDDSVNERCLHNKCSFNHVFTVHNVEIAVKKLKHHKSDGWHAQFSDCIINGTHQMIIYLSFLFNVMLTHGSSPEKLLNTVVIQIPKDKRKSQSKSENYRGIALSSIIGKVLDLMILCTNSSALETCELQFGFKEHHSTTHCTMIVNEVVEYYKSNKTDTYILMLDASKAFDRVIHIHLAKRICPLIIRLLLYMYCHQHVMIKWGNCMSRAIKTSNGVKQGGILSPVLFTLYMDELLLKLKKAGFGCHIGNTFVGGMSYADDVVLLSPTVSSLKLMLDICHEFGAAYDVRFNPNKYNLLHFSMSDDTIDGLYFNNVYIDCVKVLTHLGHYIGPQSEEVSSMRLLINLSSM